MRYRKIPHIVEAVQWDGYNLSEVVKFCEGKLTYKMCDSAWKVNKGAPIITDMYIETLEGKMHISKGDYIVKGTKGEFYPCKPEVFEEVYEYITQYDLDKEEAEIKSLKETIADLNEVIKSYELAAGVRGERTYYKKFLEEYRKQPGKELSVPDFDYIFQLYFEQQALIEQLQKEKETQHGYWIFRPRPHPLCDAFECSVCHKLHFKHEYKCPLCNSIMDLKGDE